MKKRISVFIVIVCLWLAGCVLPTYQPLAALQAATIAPATAAQWTATQPPTATATAAACVVIAAALNFRNCPALSCQVQAWPTAGEILTLTGETRGEWLQVRNAAGVIGWIHSNYCKGK